MPLKRYSIKSKPKNNNNGNRKFIRIGLIGHVSIGIDRIKNTKNVSCTLNCTHNIAPKIQNYFQVNFDCSECASKQFLQQNTARSNQWVTNVHTINFEWKNDEPKESDESTSSDTSLLTVESVLTFVFIFAGYDGETRMILLHAWSCVWAAIGS